MKVNIEASLEKLRRAAPPTLPANVDLAVGRADGYRIYESPVGDVAVAFNPTGVSMVRLTEEDFESEFVRQHGRRLLTALPPRGWDSLIGKAIEAGRPGALPMDLRALSPFRRRILEIATTIPRGQVRPYSWLAQEAGKSGAARAVGSAMAQNPVPLIVPCHRVIRSDGMIGAYSLGGPHNKWVLLDSEGADPSGLQRQAETGVRYVASEATRVFCYPTCDQARAVAPTHQVRFRSKEQALGQGYKPCQECRPA